MRCDPHVDALIRANERHGMMTVASRMFITGLALAAFTVAVTPTATAAVPATQPAAESVPTRHEVEVAPGKTVAYLVSEPNRPTASKDRWIVVFLHGAGGSLTGYNFARPPYAKIRQSLAQNGAYVVVPALGRLHFMNDEAKASLTKVIDKVSADFQIDPTRVHMMGTSMGAGSALAYALHRPNAVRSVCAIMPMTDFAEWVKENPKYAEPLRLAYGGTALEKPEAYDVNSALKHPDALANIPVLLVHGMNDKSVLPSQSEKLAAMLKAKGYPCTFIAVKDGGHKDDIVTDLQDQIAQFLMNANE